MSGQPRRVSSSARIGRVDPQHPDPGDGQGTGGQRGERRPAEEVGDELGLGAAARASATRKTAAR